MNIFIDIVVILIILACSFLGYKRGLTGVIVRLLSTVLSIIISLMLFKPISNIVINHTNIYSNLTNTIENSINNDMDKKKMNSEKPNVLIKSINNSVEKAKHDANKIIATRIAETVINFIVALIIFAITNIVLFFLRFLFGAITQLPIVKQLDKLGGVVYGLVEALLVIYIILGIFSFANVPELQLAIKTSFLTSFLYNNNLILLLLFK